VQHLDEVPRDRFALTVLVGGEVELVGLPDELLQLRDLGALLLGYDVQRLEVVVGVDSETRPRLVLVGLGPPRNPAMVRAFAGDSTMTSL
jgi:hypothetical protein